MVLRCERTERRRKSEEMSKRVKIYLYKSVKILRGNFDKLLTALTRTTGMA